MQMASTILHAIACKAKAVGTLCVGKRPRRRPAGGGDNGGVHAVQAGWFMVLYGMAWWVFRADMSTGWL